MFLNTLQHNIARCVSETKYQLELKTKLREKVKVRMRVSKLAGISIVLCAVIVIITTAYAGNTVQSQDVRMLDSRITQLEQRLYSIESRINRLEQFNVTQRSASPTPSTRDPELNVISDQIQNLTLRVSETECGLLKLDERTATTRKGPGTRPSDPCRVNAAAPLRLSTRP